MPEPLVCAVMLVDGRWPMVKRAMAAFQHQTYQRRKMFVLNTGAEDVSDLIGDAHYEWRKRPAGARIGTLRNIANALTRADILIHWDSDDWSHPERIAQQVALLQASGDVDAVGYNEMLFWREAVHYPECGHVPGDCGHYHPGQAWRYTGSILGTSLCYWRDAWSEQAFSGRMDHGEDSEWLTRVKSVAAPSICAKSALMVAAIHAGNAGNSAYIPSEMANYPAHWSRVAEWDPYCAGVMA